MSDYSSHPPEAVSQFESSLPGESKLTAEDREWLHSLFTVTAPTVPANWFLSRVAESQAGGRHFEGTKWNISCAGYEGNQKTEDRQGAHEFEKTDGTKVIFNGLYDGHGGGKKKAMVSQWMESNAGRIMEETFRAGLSSQTTRELFEEGLRSIYREEKSAYNVDGTKPDGLRGGAMNTISLMVPSENKCYLANDGDSETTCTFRDEEGNRTIKAMFAEDTYKSSAYQRERGRISKFLGERYGNPKYGLVKESNGTVRIAGSLMPASGGGDHEYDKFGFGHEWKIREVDIEDKLGGTLEYVIQTTDGLGDAATMRNNHKEVTREEYWRKAIDAMSNSVNALGVNDEPAARAVLGALGFGTNDEIWSIAPGPARNLGRDDIQLSALLHTPDEKASKPRSFTFGGTCSGKTSFVDLADQPVDVCVA